MKIQMIDLLNKIFNGEEVPKTIKYKYETFIFNDDLKRYVHINDKDSDSSAYCLGGFFALDMSLNDEVEIIEEKLEKIEKLTLNGKTIGFGIMKEWMDFTPNDNEQKICNAIETIGINQNKIIKAVNYLLEKSDKE